MKGNFHVQFGIGGGEGDLIADTCHPYHTKAIALHGPISQVSTENTRLVASHGDKHAQITFLDD